VIRLSFHVIDFSAGRQGRRGRENQEGGSETHGIVLKGGKTLGGLYPK
jgi:hypothetical protein